MNAIEFDLRKDNRKEGAEYLNKYAGDLLSCNVGTNEHRGDCYFIYEYERINDSLAIQLDPHKLLTEDDEDYYTRLDFTEYSIDSDNSLKQIFYSFDVSAEGDTVVSAVGARDTFDFYPYKFKFLEQNQ